jgi:hypothetical protein
MKEIAIGLEKALYKENKIEPKNGSLHIDLNVIKMSD